MKKKKQFPQIHSRKFPLFEIICLLFVGGALYWGTLDHTFHFDDKQNIWNNATVQISSLSIDSLIKAGFQGNMETRPVANMSFALNYYVNGLDVRGYHVVNILVHIFAAVLLFYFVRITMGLPPVRERFGDIGLIPFFTALIWLVHPLHIQSVTYIVQRMNSMAAMFFIMAMLFYVKARIDHHNVRRIVFWVMSFLAGILALGSKENAITLPICILLYEWYFFQDLRLKFTKKQLLGAVLLVILSIFAAYFFLGDSPLQRLTAGYGGRPFTLAQRLLTEPRVVVHYITLLLYPHPGRLNLDYDFALSHSLVSPVGTLLSIAFLVSMLGVALYKARKNRLLSFAILWFLGNLVVESSIIALEIAYEHRTYLPSMMAILLLVIFFHYIARKRKVLLVVLVSVTLLFSYWTLERNKVWQDELSLWSDCWGKSPNKARVNQNVGTAYLAAGRVDEAIVVFHKALNLYLEEIKLQDHVSSRLTSFHLRNLGSAYKQKGEYRKAIVYLNRALKEFYFDAETHFFLGFCYTRIWRLQEAVDHLSTALRFSQHHSADLSMQANAGNIRRALEKARQMQKAQQKRQEQLQNNSDS